MVKKNICVNCPKYCRQPASSKLQRGEQANIKSFIKLLQADLNNNYKKIIFNCDFCKKMIAKIENGNQPPKELLSIIKIIK